MVNFGFHLSISGKDGLVNSLRQASNLGINAMQIFTKSPRRWQTNKINEGQTNQFRELRHHLKIQSIVVHSSYLVNLGSDEELKNKSLTSILDDIRKAESLKVEYVLFHPGTGDFKKIRAGLLELTPQIPADVQVLIKNTASNKNKVCSQFEHLRNLIEGTNLRLCLDTCHAFAAKYRLNQNPTSVISDLDNLIGLNRIPVIHFNDAVGDCGSGLDRHASLLEGKIGINLKHMLQDVRFKDKVFIIECPKEKYQHNLSVLGSWLNA